MAHYALKCVYCYKTIDNAAVKFKLEDAVTDSISAVAVTSRNTDEINTTVSEESEFSNLNDSDGVSLDAKKSSSQDSDGFDWFSDDEWSGDEDSGSKDGGEKRSVVSGLYTVDEIKHLFPEGDVTVETANVLVTSDAMPCKDALSREVTYKTGGEVKRLTRRYCPHCGNPLPVQSGMMPTYIITLLGTSSSGKTVYLAALYRLLTRNGIGNGKLPYKGFLKGVEAGISNQNISGLSRMLYEDGYLPATTINQFDDPITFQLTFSTENGGKALKRCLTALVDMKGEDLTDANATTLAMKHQMYRSSDAFLFIVDPSNMPEYYAKAQYDRPTAPSSAHVVLQQLVQDHVASQFPNQEIRKPSVIAITKADILMRNAHLLGIPASSYTVQAESTSNMCKEKKYLRTFHREAENLVGHLDPNLKYFLNNAFPNAFYTTIASLGSKPTIIKEGNRLVVRNATIASAIRVEDPLLLLLIKLGFLPPYYNLEMPPPPPEVKARPKERAERIERIKATNEANNAVLREWGRTHLQ